MIPRFEFTDRATPVVQLGIGDARTVAGNALWDVALWDSPTDRWVGTEVTWVDITCHTHQFSCEYGRARIVDRFVAGAATVLVDNTTGWADPANPVDLNDLTVRPGRPIRMGVVHATLGVRWLFRGFVDAVTPVYDPVQPDTVQFDCVDALGEVNRTKFIPLAVPIGTGDTVHARIDRLLNRGRWPDNKRDLHYTADTLIADNLDGQLADLLSQAADSNGGSVFGDLEANIAYRPRDWQTYPPGTPVDGTIGNAGPDVNRVTFDEDNYLYFGDQVIFGATDAGDVCPTRWERPFNRADITTRAIMGRENEPGTLVQADDLVGQALYGIEPFERRDLIPERLDMLDVLANRVLRTRGVATAPRVRSVSLSAATADNALDLMTTVDVYKPSRYRCRLELPRGVVFDDEYFATAVAHEVTPTSWTLDLNLDVAAPFAVPGEAWDSGHWDETVWFAPVRALVDEARELIGAL